MAVRPTRKAGIPKVRHQELSLQRTLDAIIERLEVIDGLRGDSLDRAVTFRDLTDAGVSGFREYQHTHCGSIWEIFVSDEEDAREAIKYRRPCPVCNAEYVLKAWGQWDELLPAFKRVRDDWCPMTPERFASFSAVDAWGQLTARGER